jgi:antitoxin ParD1/3/4
MPDEPRAALEAAKLQTLVKAAEVGFRDIDEGRFDGVRDDDLERFVSGLGRLASARIRSCRDP